MPRSRSPWSSPAPPLDGCDLEIHRIDLPVPVRLPIAAVGMSSREFEHQLRLTSPMMTTQGYELHYGNLLTNLW